MKICPITTYTHYYKYQSLPKQLTSKNTSNNTEVINNFFYYPLTFTSKKQTQKVDFQCTPISSKKPIKEYFNGDYSDVVAFSKFFSKKLNASLQTVSAEDVDNLINRLKQDTKADEQTILKVLYSLTKYSTYKALSNIEGILNQNKVRTIAGKNFSLFSDLWSTNASLKYLHEEKQQMHLNGRKKGVILDNLFLCKLERIEKPEQIEKIIFQEKKSKAQLDDIVHFILPGWDIKCSDGKYRSANMFSGTNQLEEIAKDVINRMNNGENIEDIMYSDLEERLKDAYAKLGIDKDDINIIKEKTTLNKRNIQRSDILRNLQTDVFNPNIIENKIMTFIESKNVPSEERKDLIIAITKYLDELSVVYSVDKMAQELKQLKDKIVKKAQNMGYSEDEIIYYTPSGERTKSFNLVSNMFYRINNIPIESIAPKGMNPDEFKDKVIVIIDDMSVTGQTQYTQTQYMLGIEDEEESNNDVIYATLLSCNGYFPPQTQKRCRELTKSVYVNRVPNFVNIARKSGIEENFNFFSKFKLLTPEDFKNLKKLYLGWGNTGLSCFFPYMIPDNSSNISGYLFDIGLHISNEKSNKSEERPTN